MPLADLLMERFKVKTRAVESPDETTVGATAEVILGNNPNRLAWVIVNLHASNVLYLALKSTVSTTKGIRVDAAGGSASMVWDEDFQATAWAVWGVADADDTDIFWLEVVEY